MKLKNIYLTAAKQIDSGEEEFSCNAVGRCGGAIPKEFYRKVMGFAPTNYTTDDLFLQSVEDDSDAEIDVVDDTVKELRVLLLCMMAACCEDMEEV